MKRIDQLTFPRFLAVLVVVFFHGGGGIYFDALNFFPLAQVIRSATLSVTFLYVLSGFVMALAHYRPTEPVNLEAYWKSRLARLYPLYLAAFLLTAYYYGVTVTTARLGDVLANLFMVQAWVPKYAQSYNFPAWSVSVEIFFYALFPAFAWWAARQPQRRLIWLALIVWGVSQFIHNTLWVCCYPKWQYFLIYFPPFHLGSFLLGVTGGISFLRANRQPEVSSRVNLSCLTGSFLLACLYVVISSRISTIPRGDQLMTGLLAPFLAVTVFTLARDTSRFARALTHPVLLALGESSYAIYIFHIPVKWLYERALAEILPGSFQVIFAYTYLPLLILLGLAVTTQFERRLRQWVNRALQSASLPLLLLDLAIYSFSVYYAFFLRLENMRTRAEHYSTFLLMFWSVFVLRSIFAILFKTVSPENLLRPLLQSVRPFFFTSLAGSVSITAFLYVGYRLNWVAYFPLSVIALEWALVFVFGFILRIVFHMMRFYAPQKY